MAKKSQVERQKKRARTVAQYAEKRRAFKRMRDYDGLDNLPRDASPTRLKNRCHVTGRARGYMRKFGVSRIVFREMALKGLIPGVRKSSW
jgi:small subunit ribosomal protein S14